jgi:hypothetical protein
MKKIRKNKGKGVELMEGTRKSTRLEANEEIKITEKAISRAVAKDAFLNKERNIKKDAAGRKLPSQKNG